MAIYFIQCNGDDGPIKIGQTRDVSSRLNGLQGSNPYKLKLLRVLRGHDGMEGQLHEQFSELRIHGEWFRPGKELLDFIKHGRRKDLRRKEKCMEIDYWKLKPLYSKIRLPDCTCLETVKWNIIAGVWFSITCRKCGWSYRGGADGQIHVRTLEDYNYQLITFRGTT